MVFVKLWIDRNFLEKNVAYHRLLGVQNYNPATYVLILRTVAHTLTKVWGSVCGSSYRRECGHLFMQNGCVNTLIDGVEFLLTNLTHSL